MRNADDKTIAGFGDEWTRFDQSAISEAELRSLFARYFDVFPWESLSAGAQGFDLGCGSGRWARFVSERVGLLHCIDASAEALEVSAANLRGRDNCRLHHASVDAIPLADGSMDFGYSLGVLHHVPDTAAGIRACVAKLKPGAPLLLYLYYAFDNRPAWFRLLWKASDRLRRVISKLPFPMRSFISQAIAVIVYWPLSRLAGLAERLGANVENFPLAPYRKLSLYTLRTDALDRFGTRLEQRFTAARMKSMMEAAGLERIAFGSQAPYWVAVGYRKSP